MRAAITVAAVGLVLSLGLVEPVVAAQCPDDSVASGTVCIDKYEASVWYVPPEQKGLIQRIQRGTVGLADLMAAGAVQLGSPPATWLPLAARSPATAACMSMPCRSRG